MYYSSKPVVFIIEDGDVAREINRLSEEDELEFSKYVSSLVEKDILEKFGKSVYNPDKIVETEVTSVAKNNSFQEQSYLEIIQKLDKLDKIISLGSFSQVGAITAQNSVSRTPSMVIENPTTVHSEIQEVKDFSNVVNTTEDENKTESYPSIPKKKKKSKLGLKGKNSMDVLSKMQSMQK